MRAVSRFNVRGEDEMIQLLCVLGIISAVVVVLANAMLANHFKKIERSLAIYHDSKIYKNALETAFLDGLIKAYKELTSIENETMDVSVLIESIFYDYKIGKFKYKLIQGIATKGQVLVWMILFFQIALEVIRLTTDPSIHSSMFYIIGTAIICIILTVRSLFRNVDEEKNQLLIKIKHYLVNTYPVEMKEKAYRDEITQLTSRINKLEVELAACNKETVTKETIQPSIKEEDVRLLLKQIDKPL